jgi:hypothetical protein
MSARKIFPGGMIKPVNIPNINFSQFQVQSSAFNSLAQRLDRLTNFAVQQGEKIAIEEGKEFAASNPLNADTFYNADPEEREKLVGGDNITSYGRALKIAQINLLATDLSIKAQGDFTKLKIVAVGSDMDADMYEQGLNAIVKGYSDSLLSVDAEAAITVKAQLASKANTLYTSYLDDKIKDYNTIKSSNLQNWGQTQLDSIPDEIKAGTMRTIEIDGATQNVTVEEFLDLKKKEYFDKIAANPKLKKYSLTWEKEWDARVQLELKNYLYTQIVDTNENRETMSAASKANKEVQNGTFFGNKEAQRIFNNLDSEEQKKFKAEVRTWKADVISSREKDETGSELDLKTEKELLTQEYLQAETDNDTEKVNEILAQAYKLDTALGNEFKKLFNSDLKSGLFFDPDTEVNLFFDLYNGTLSEREIMDAVSAGNIGKDTAISLRSQIVSMRKDSYAKADAELRKTIGIPEPGSITPGFIETKKYRQYVKRSAELLKFYNDNPAATPQELITFARDLEDKQEIINMNEDDFKKKSNDLTSMDGPYKMSSSEWDKYFREFYNEKHLTVQTDFLSFNDKSKIGLLIKELEELKLMTDGVKYVPSTVPPGELEVDPGKFGFGGAKEFKRPEGVTNREIDMIIDILEDMQSE